MGDEKSGTPASKGFPNLTPVSMRPPSIRDFQFQFIGDGANSKLHQNVQSLPLAFSPLAPPGHTLPTSGPSSMQRSLSPARLSRQPLLARLGQPQTQLVPEMREETALSKIACSPASHSALSGIATSHPPLSRVLHAVPTLERQAPDVTEFQMQVDTDASEPTHQNAMDLDGGPPLPWRNPFAESDEVYSTTVRKFQLADVFAETEKVTEEWSKVERPQIPLPKRQRLPQVTSPTTRAETKAPLHKLSPRVMEIPVDSPDADARSWPSPNVDRPTILSVAAVPVLEAPSQPPALAERSVDVEQRIQRLQELVRRGGQEGGQEGGQATGNPFPDTAAQSCGPSPPKFGDTGTVCSLPFNPLGGPSARQHARSSAKPLTADDGRQSIEQSVKGQLFAPERTCQPASATAAAQSTGPSVCLTHLPPPNSKPPCNDSEVPSAVVIRTPTETRPSFTAAAPLSPPAPPLRVKTEPMAIKHEPSSPKLHPLVQPVTVAEVPGAPIEATGRLPEFAPPATPLDRRVSAPLQDIPLTSLPTVDLPNFNVEAWPPPTTLEQKMPTTASQPNTMTKSRSATPAPAMHSQSLGSSIPRAAIPRQLESTAMEVQMTQPEQGAFVPRTLTGQPNHTGPMYHSPTAPPPVPRYRRSASPPSRGQSFIRARTPPSRVTPQRPSPHRRTPSRVHPPSRSHPPRYDISARNYTDGRTQTNFNGRGRPRQEPIDLRMNSYRPLSGYERESDHPSHELEPRDPTFSSYSRDWLRDRYHPKSMETEPAPPAQYPRYSQGECHMYRGPSEPEWSHLSHRDLETSEISHQMDSSHQRHPANENMSPLGRSTYTRLETSLPSYPSAASGPRSAGSSLYSRDVNWGPGRSEALQAYSSVPPTGLIAPSVQIEERTPASKRAREPECSPSLEEPIHPTKSTSITGPALKRQKVDPTSSQRQTGGAGASQTLVGMTSYRLEQISNLFITGDPGRRYDGPVDLPNYVSRSYWCTQQSIQHAKIASRTFSRPPHFSFFIRTRATLGSPTSPRRPRRSLTAGCNSTTPRPLYE